MFTLCINSQSDFLSYLLHWHRMKSDRACVSLPLHTKKKRKGRRPREHSHKSPYQPCIERQQKARKQMSCGCVMIMNSFQCLVGSRFGNIFYLWKSKGFICFLFKMVLNFAAGPAKLPDEVMFLITKLVCCAANKSFFSGSPRGPERAHRLQWNWNVGDGDVSSWLNLSENSRRRNQSLSRITVSGKKVFAI